MRNEVDFDGDDDGANDDGDDDDDSDDSDATLSREARDGAWSARALQTLRESQPLCHVHAARAGRESPDRGLHLRPCSRAARAWLSAARARQVQCKLHAVVQEVYEDLEDKQTQCAVINCN